MCYQALLCTHCTSKVFTVSAAVYHREKSFVVRRKLHWNWLSQNSNLSSVTEKEKMRLSTTSIQCHVLQKTQSSPKRPIRVLVVCYCRVAPTYCTFLRICTSTMAVRIQSTKTKSFCVLFLPVYYHVSVKMWFCFVIWFVVYVSFLLSSQSCICENVILLKWHVTVLHICTFPTTLQKNLVIHFIKN